MGYRAEKAKEREDKKAKAKAQKDKEVAEKVTAAKKKKSSKPVDFEAKILAKKEKAKQRYAQRVAKRSQKVEGARRRRSVEGERGPAKRKRVVGEKIKKFFEKTEQAKSVRSSKTFRADVKTLEEKLKQEKKDKAVYAKKA